MTIRHATLTANSTGAGGAAGIAMAGAGGAAPTPGSLGTVSAGSPGSPGSGGAANVDFFSSTPTTLTNSIVAGNAAPACKGAVADGGHDISFGDSSCPGTDVDPKLGVLASNGGPTRTQALLAGSPAINGVPASGAGCPTTDQRRVKRPNGRACDIGAYDHAPPTVKTGGASNISATRGKVHGRLNPNARSTTYHFEYGKTTAYGTSTRIKKQPPGTSTVEVLAALSGLKARTTYHYRLVATNADGTRRGADRTFKTGA